MNKENEMLMMATRRSLKNIRRRKKLKSEVALQKRKIILDKEK